jgi:DNA-binding LytR/AlgR family response regulator
MKTYKVSNLFSEKDKILFIKADQNYSVFYLENGLKYISGYTLKFHEEHLSDTDFLRVNRSMLIHKSFVRVIKEKKNACYVIMKNGKNVLISRRRVKAIQEQYLGA